MQLTRNGKMSIRNFLYLGPITTDQHPPSPTPLNTSLQSEHVNQDPAKYPVNHGHNENGI